MIARLFAPLLFTACNGKDDDSVASESDADTDTDTDSDTDADTDTDTDTDSDTDTDTDITYDCGKFTEAPKDWKLAKGLRAVVVADSKEGLQEPVGLTFAGGKFGGKLYASDQGGRTVWAVDTITGATTAFVEAKDLETKAALITGIIWDANNQFDGNLYLSDTVSTSDQYTTLYRIDPSAKASIFTQAPGPGLNEVYAMAFAPAGSPIEGLFVSGDTDGGIVDWAVYDSAGKGTAFSEVAGAEGMTFDPTGAYGDGPIAALASGGGWSGDGSITPLDFKGNALKPIATGLGGVHANVMAPPGLFGGEMLAASWSTGNVFRISPAGKVTTIASGLSLTEYDANILAVSPDGHVLMVADRLESRIVCIEEE